MSARVETILAAAMRSPDPVATVRAALADPTVDTHTRAALAAADPDGLRVAALLVLQLRFERLQRGAPDARAWFDQDPDGFTALFLRYHVEVPPPSIFPQDEARAWAAWRTS